MAGVVVVVEVSVQDQGRGGMKPAVRVSAFNLRSPPFSFMLAHLRTSLFGPRCRFACICLSWLAE